MATSFAPILLQAFDDYGTLLAGGKINTYEAGTTTPMATYQDLAGAVPNTNPVILDASGRATVRVTNGVAYKFVITDSDDVEIVTLDNIIVGQSASESTVTYYVHQTFEGTPGAQGFMGGHIFGDNVTFPIDLEGAQGAVLTAPGSEYVVSIRKNAVEVATASIDTSGVYTFATTSGVTVSFSSGDIMTFIAPDSGTAADFSMSIPGAVV